MIQLVDNRGLLLMLKLLLIRLEPVPTGVRCLYTYYLISLLKLPYKKNIIIFILPVVSLYQYEALSGIPRGHHTAPKSHLGLEARQVCLTQRPGLNLPRSCFFVK